MKYTIQVLMDITQEFAGIADREKSYSLSKSVSNLQALNQAFINAEVEDLITVALVPNGWKLVKE